MRIIPPHNPVPIDRNYLLPFQLAVEACYRGEDEANLLFVAASYPLFGASVGRGLRFRRLRGADHPQRQVAHHCACEEEVGPRRSLAIVLGGARFTLGAGLRFFIATSQSLSLLHIQLSQSLNRRRAQVQQERAFLGRKHFNLR